MRYRVRKNLLVFIVARIVPWLLTLPCLLAAINYGSNVKETHRLEKVCTQEVTGTLSHITSNYYDDALRYQGVYAYAYNGQHDEYRVSESHWYEDSVPQTTKLLINPDNISEVYDDSSLRMDQIWCIAFTVATFLMYVKVVRPSKKSWKEYRRTGR
ncbi:MAG: hypothetical protein NC548_10730 [Lachnospiraceae bacterium]|nr:hypothetical protein [Lachnospiraceae bacterium]